MRSALHCKDVLPPGTGCPCAWEEREDREEKPGAVGWDGKGAAGGGSWAAGPRGPGVHGDSGRHGHWSSTTELPKGSRPPISELPQSEAQPWSVPLKAPLPLLLPTS